MLADRGAPESQPLYGRWIEMYSTPEFAELAEWLRSFIDRIAEGCSSAELLRMEHVFRTSSHYEYKFWDAAFHMEQWPV
jgi:thiaminase/transcriptional activator TenA